MCSAIRIFLLFMNYQFVMGNGQYGQFKETKRQPSFMSIHKVVAMLETEQIIVEKMKSMVDIEDNMSQNLVSEIEGYIQRYEDMMSKNRSLEEIAYHPIDVYRVVKDITISWKHIRKLYQTESTSALATLDEITQLRKEAKYSEDIDITTLSVAVVTLQEFYELDVNDMIIGKLINPRTKKVYHGIYKLKAWDCILFGKAANSEGLYGLAVDWYQKAKILREAGDTSIRSSTAERELDKSVEMHDTVLIQKGPWGPTWKTKKFPIGKQSRVDKKRFQLAEKNQGSKFYSHMEYREMKEQQRVLCKGAYTRPPILDEGLYCYYVTHNNPYLLIGPFKMEQLSRDFSLTRVHDFIYDSEIEKIKEIAGSQLNDSTYRYPHKDGTFHWFTGSRRLSQEHWMSLSEDVRLLTVIMHRCEDAFKLKYTSISDKFGKVMNYGVGGRYGVHRDYIQVEEIPDEKNEFMQIAGDVVATILINLSDVEAGGATVFPIIGKTVWPKKGSVLMWYDLDKAGIGDYSTHHAGCPVLYGSKWSLAMIPLLYDQMFTSSNCGLHRLDKHSLL